MYQNGTNIIGILIFEQVLESLLLTMTKPEDIIIHIYIYRK